MNAHSSQSLLGKYISFNMPMFKAQLGIYTISSAIIAIVILLPTSGFVKTGLYSLFYFVMSVMYQLAPCAMTRYSDARIVERLLPISTKEKFFTLAIYFFAIIALAVYLLPELSIIAYKHIPSIQSPEFDEILALRDKGGFWITLSNILAGLAGAVTCFYFVNHVRHNRMLWGIVSTFLSNVVMGIIGAIWGISMAFRAGFSDGYAGKEACANDLQGQLVYEIYNQTTFFLIYSIILAGYSALILWLAYRDMKKRNL